MAELVFREFSCQKAVNGSNFAQGNQDYDFSIGAPSAWIPALTYFKVKSQLTAVQRSVTNTAVANQPTHNDQIAYAEHFTAALFNSCKFEAGGQEVSQIEDWVAQAQALKMRCGRSGAWANTIGKSAYLMEADFQKRVSMIAFDDPQFASDQMSYIPLSIAVTNNVSIATDGTVTTANNLPPNYAALQAGDLVFASLFSDDGKVNKGAVVQYTVTTAGGSGALILSLKNGAAIPTAPLTSASVTLLYGLRPLRYDGGQRNSIFTMFQPPLGIFQSQEPMGAGDYRFSLNPNPSYQFAAVESTRPSGNTLGGGAAAIATLGDNAGLVPASSIATPANGDFSLNILDIRLYVAILKTSIPKQVTQLELQEVLIRTKPLATGAGVQTFDYVVPSSTQALALFVQSGAAGFNTNMSPARFVTVNPASASTINSQNLITGIQLTYANVSKPPTKWDSAYDNALTVTGSINQAQQRYHDDLCETQLLSNPGGAETLGEWIQRGPYYYYAFNRDREDRSTQVQVSITFANPGPEASSNLMLAAFYSRVTEITVADGRVQQVRGLNR